MWKEYLSFSKSERITFLSLTIIIVLLLILSRGISAVKISDSLNLVEEAKIKEFYNTLNDTLDSVKSRNDVNKWHSSYKVKSSISQYKVDTLSTSRSFERKYRSKKSDIMQIEINSADTAIFSLLPGVGSIISSRIVKYRSVLKGFYAKDQLLEVYGVDSLLYSKISSYLIVDSITIEKQNLNEMPVGRMKNHPYLNFYQAKAIYEYRNKVGNFESIKDVFLLPEFENMNFDRLARYFCVK